jgi:glycosyltransferase involved in cell wall biosynthesis
VTRVVTGPTEVAGTAWGLKKALASVGARADVVLWSPPPSELPSGRVLSRGGRVLFSAAAPFRYDVFHYHYGSTWARFVDAWWARLLRRTLVVRYHGDDCRLYSIAAQRFEPRARVVPREAEPARRRRLRRLARVAHAAIVADLELAAYVEPFYSRVYVTPLALHPPAGSERAQRDETAPPVVLHACTAPEIKGTAAITAAAEAVAERVPLDYRLLVSQPHARVQDELRSADIVVDQLNSVTSGVFALEALRLGIPVLGELDRSALPPYQRELPVVAVSPATLETELEALVRDHSRRAELGRRGRAYVERIYEPERIGRTMLAIYAHARTAAPGVYEATADRITPL